MEIPGSCYSRPFNSYMLIIGGTHEEGKKNYNKEPYFSGKYFFGTKLYRGTIFQKNYIIKFSRIDISIGIV